MVNTNETRRLEATRLPWLSVEADWPQVGAPPADCDWSGYQRALFWLVLDYLDAVGAPASRAARLKRATWAARLGLLDAAYERTDVELAAALCRSVRTVRALRADFRSALVRADELQVDPRPIPVEFGR